MLKGWLGWLVLTAVLAAIAWSISRGHWRRLDAWIYNTSREDHLARQRADEQHLRRDVFDKTPYVQPVVVRTAMDRAVAQASHPMLISIILALGSGIGAQLAHERTYPWFHMPGYLLAGAACMVLALWPTWLYAVWRSEIAQDARHRFAPDARERHKTRWTGASSAHLALGTLLFCVCAMAARSIFWAIAR